MSCGTGPETSSPEPLFDFINDVLKCVRELRDNPTSGHGRYCKSGNGLNSYSSWISRKQITGQGGDKITVLSIENCSCLRNRSDFETFVQNVHEENPYSATYFSTMSEQYQPWAVELGFVRAIPEHTYAYNTATSYYRPTGLKPGKRVIEVPDGHFT
jgi:hypothetical protein